MISVKYNLSVIPGFNQLIHSNNNVSSCTSNILKLNKMECRTSNNAEYKVIRYDKNFLAHDLVPTYGLCRSVIVNIENKVVGFAPPKSISSEKFIKEYSEKTEGVVAEEFIEGTMINVFWDPSIGLNGGWEISTRNTVGATSSFYKSGSNKCKTFRDMFLEAAEQNGLVLQLLNPIYSYSFVVQHPENRIVVPFKKPQLYLVGVYSIINNSISDNNVIVQVFDHQIFKQCFEQTNTTIKFPQIYSFHTYSELIEKYGSMNTSYDILGVVLHNKLTGERAKIRNPVYEQVRSLRGNQPKLQFQYLSLRNEGKVKDFLEFYPENKKEFSTFRDQVHLFTDTLYTNYRSCYVKKEKPLKEFPDQYRTHMFNLHQKYMTELREKKMFITGAIVQKYVNEMAPTLLMYCLNFNMRKRRVDTVAADANI
jgi:hypothetical protein